MPLTVPDVMNLLTDPQTLMRKAYVAIAGGGGAAPANGVAPVATFTVTVEDANPGMLGFTSGISGLFGRTKERPTVRITKRAGAALAVPGPDQFNAYYIAMAQVADVGTASHYGLPRDGAVTLCITSMITACCFSVGHAGDGSVLVSHIQPPPAALGVTLADRQAAAVAAGLTEFNGAPTQFRNNFEYDSMRDRIAIMGVFAHHRWRFYAQKTSIVNTGSMVRSAAAFVAVD
ncbi:hypothetical protein [Plastoroseomonas hellenica]|uniref:hypothetical protein n=1 Tax=Plastoroseomonas hellenica TaxID=2687306 RepID=UPI001BA90C60|nr:hypothetical protein [Plastoroseomonas hellenica]MBR0641300.1 hypothetical protein [Plastoroseomonas hellenica]